MTEPCYFCKGKVEKRSVQHVHQWGDKVFIFKNVPADVCVQCGETYFVPETLDTMDKVVAGPAEPDEITPVPVYSL